MSSDLYVLGKGFGLDEEFLRLDFSKEAHRAFFVCELGGEEFFRSNMPNLYERFLDAVRRDKEPKSLEVGEPDIFQDEGDIFYGFYNKDKGTIVFKGCTSIERRAEHICQRVHIYDMRGDLVLALGNVSYNVSRAILEFEKPVELSSYALENGLYFQFFSMWYDEENGVSAGIYNAYDDIYWKNNAFVEDVVMIDPVHKRTKETSNIVVCYNRTCQSGELVDYDCYEEAYDSKTKRQYLYLDLGADVRLSKEAGKFYSIDLSKLNIKLDSGSGIANYVKLGREQEIIKSFVATDNGFSFRLDKDWKGVVPSSRLPIKDDVYLMFRVDFLTDGGRKRGRLNIESDRGLSGTGYVKNISKLYLLWGCVADNSHVVVLDGLCERKVLAKDVAIGDKVLGIDGRFCAVKDVVKGREVDAIYHIETEKGKFLECTCCHPLFTKRGFVMAEDIRFSDCVLTVDGYERVSMVYPVIYEDVVSFVFEEDFVMYCNGLAVGDFGKQEELIRAKRDCARVDFVDPEIEILRCFWNVSL